MIIIIHALDLSYVTCFNLIPEILRDIERKK